MIPLRVCLKNFLCHRDQVFAFDGHSVWLLHGPNGVGKSAVFDGMVYALFGKHKRREGSDTGVSDLVRNGESSMRVEFDFEFRCRRYRVWRTRTRRGSPKQGVGEFRDGSPDPRPIKDVNSGDELDAWVCETLGLNYDTFVSSVLLRQGAAERLIDAKKETRRDVFRGIIDLDPYILLHDRVVEARRQVNAEVRLLTATLQGMPEVTEEAIATATARMADAEAAWERERVAETATRDRLAHARRWEGLDAACRTLRQQLAVARDRTERAAELERRVTRLRELRLIVPALRRVAELCRAVEAAEQRFGDLTARQAVAAETHEGLVAAGQQERDKAVTHRTRLGELDREIREVRAECDRLREQIGQAEKAADLHRKLEAERAKRFDADLDARLGAAETALAEAQAARDAFPHLEQLLRHRTAYHLAAADARQAAEREATATADVTRLQAEEADAVLLADAEADRATTAGRAVAVAEDQLVTARNALGRFGSVAGEAACPECGRELDPEHVERHRGELERRVRDTEAQAVRLREESRAATDTATEVRQAAQQTQSDRQRAESARAEAGRDRRQAESRLVTARTAFENARGELSPGLAERAGELSTGIFPTEADVSTARETGRHVATRTHARDALRTRCQERDATVGRIEDLEQAVLAVGAPADVTATREALATGEQRLAALNQARIDSEQAQSNADQAERDLGRRAGEAAADVNRLAGAAGAAEADARNARQSRDEAVRVLPDWTSTEDVVALGGELGELEKADAEQEFEAMAEDRREQLRRERELADAERQIEETVPADARRPAAGVAVELTVAGQSVRDSEHARDAARSELAERARQRADREATRQRLTAAETRHSLHDRLVGLLGSEGIQLDLVRSAERRIIDLANVTLGRVSHGDLRFEPPDPAATEPFDLSVRRVGSPEPIPVGNLSGGQRCRVAVSLALGVCRFACGEAQPLQSVIIDEAFANLDREGRMAMVDVLRDGQVAGDMLRRIIVVSHHEDIAAAFPVGYRLANDGGVTIVTRFGP